MAIPSLPVEQVRAMNAKQRTEYFEEYARYFSDSSAAPYAIRIGSKTLFSDDTYDLRKKFDHFLRYGK